MASTRLAGLVLGVIIVSLALKYSFACAHEGTARKSKWLAGIESQNHASSQNDFLDDVSGDAVADIAGRKALKGRKMEAFVDRLSKEEKDGKQVLDEKPKISATGNYASKKTSNGAAAQDSPLEAQVSAKGIRFQNSKPLDPLQDTSKSFLDAADEVVKVMHGDYTGKAPPHRNPPVNNHKPTN